MGPSIKDVRTLRGRRCFRQKWTNPDIERGWLAKGGRPLGKKNYGYHISEIYSDNLAVCLYIKFSICLYSIENVWDAMWWHHFDCCLHSNVFTLFQKKRSVFLPFSVNCSQVAKFQIMPALCPHGQGEDRWRGGGGGAQPNVDRPGQGEWGSQKLPNLCGHPLWMTPINGLFKRYISKQWVNIEASHEKFTLLVYNFFSKSKRIFYSKFIRSDWREFHNCFHMS